MRPLLSVLLLAIVGPLLLFCREARAQSGGGGHFATDLCAELIIPNDYNCKGYQGLYTRCISLSLTITKWGTEWYHPLGDEQFLLYATGFGPVICCQVVVTDDGFILGIYNIPSPRGLLTAPSGGRPVLLQHGLEAGGDNWVLNNPQESLAFILADAGYDVWIANSRTNQWSHGHQTLNPSERAYWAWTYDEFASYDLKATTEFVYNQRGTLAYIGHSLGTQILFAGLTGGRFKTQILGYLSAAVLLAPIALTSHLSAPLLRLGLEIYSAQILTAIGTGEFSTYIFNNITCTSPLINPGACNDDLSGNLGQHNYINQSRLVFYSQYYPQPTSSFNFNHLAQGLTRGNVAFYDKGLAGNLASYGQATAPDYDLTTFPSSLPTQYWSGGVDGVANPTDTALILALLPSSNREVHTLADYGHIDLVLGYKAYQDVYPGIITFLQTHV